MALLVEVETREFHVGGASDFDVAFGAVDDIDIAARALDEGGFVGGGEAVLFGAGEGFFQHGNLEGLRRLRQNDSFARNGGGNQRDVLGKRGAANFLDRVDCRNAENRGATRARLGYDAVDLLARYERAHCIVDKNQLCVRRNFRQCVADRLLASLPALHNADRTAKVFF